jgi:hypothetical protein
VYLEFTDGHGKTLEISSLDSAFRYQSLQVNHRQSNKPFALDIVG